MWEHSGCTTAGRRASFIGSGVPALVDEGFVGGDRETGLRLLDATLSVNLPSCERQSTDFVVYV